MNVVAETDCLRGSPCACGGVVRLTSLLMCGRDRERVDPFVPICPKLLLETSVEVK